MFQLFSTKKIIPSSPIKTQTALNLFVIKYIILYSHNDNHKVARRQFFQQDDEISKIRQSSIYVVIFIKTVKILGIFQN